MLIADVVNSTALIDPADPEIALQQLDPAVGAMVAAARKFGGTIARVVGDGVKVVFGTPAAMEGSCGRRLLRRIGYA